MEKSQAQKCQLSSHTSKWKPETKDISSRNSCPFCSKLQEEFDSQMSETRRQLPGPATSELSCRHSKCEWEEYAKSYKFTLKSWFWFYARAGGTVLWLLGMSHAFLPVGDSHCTQQMQANVLLKESPTFIEKKGFWLGEKKITVNVKPGNVGKQNTAITKTSRGKYKGKELAVEGASAENGKAAHL